MWRNWDEKFLKIKDKEGIVSSCKVLPCCQRKDKVYNWCTIKSGKWCEKREGVINSYENSKGEEYGCLYCDSPVREPCYPLYQI